MSNTLLTNAKITYEALAVLKNELTFTSNINRTYDDQFAQQGAKIGSVVSVRKPVRSQGRRTATFAPEDQTETYVPLELTTNYGVDFSFSENDRTLSLDNFRDRILKPHIATLANMVDYDGMQLYKKVFQHVGTPGTTPTANSTYLAAGVLLDDAGVPRDGMRKVCLNPDGNAAIANANMALFNPSGKVSSMFQKGMIGKDTLGFDWYMDQNVGVQTIGAYSAAAGAVTVTTASTSTTVVTGGWTSADKLLAGDVVSFSGVYYVNPQNRQSTGKLAQFVLLTTPTQASGGGAMTLTLDRTPVFSGAYQNVTSSTNTIASGATVTVYGASASVTPQNLVFHRDAFAFACADLEKSPGAVNQTRVSDKDTGLSILFTPFFDGQNLRTNYRLDLLGGWACLRPELAVRVSG